MTAHWDRRIWGDTALPRFVSVSLLTKLLLELQPAELSVGFIRGFSFVLFCSIDGSTLLKSRHITDPHVLLFCRAPCKPEF